VGAGRRNAPCLSCCFGCEIGDGRGGRTRTSAARAARAIAASVLSTFFFLPSFCFAWATQRGWRAGGWRGFGGAGGAASSRCLPYHTRSVYCRCSRAAPGVPGPMRSEVGASTFESSSGKATVLSMRPGCVRCGVLSLGPSESGVYERW